MNGAYLLIFYDCYWVEERRDFGGGIQGALRAGIVCTVFVCCCNTATNGAREEIAPPFLYVAVIQQQTGQGGNQFWRLMACLTCAILLRETGSDS